MKPPLSLAILMLALDIFSRLAQTQPPGTQWTQIGCTNPVTVGQVCIQTKTLQPNGHFQTIYQTFSFPPGQSGSLPSTLVDCSSLSNSTGAIPWGPIGGMQKCLPWGNANTDGTVT